nr:ROK family protein [Tessaracoccus coleopterorum]
MVDDLVRTAPSPIIGIGVGSPGIVDADGTVLSAPNFGWERVELARLLGERVDVPVIVTNDANAAVLGEYIFAGAAQDVLLIRVGRGVGSGLLTGGRLLTGAHLAGGELGHVTIGTDGGPRCACGKVGCLEAWLAAGALSARLAAGDSGRSARRGSGSASRSHPSSVSSTSPRSSSPAPGTARRRAP